MPERAKLRAVAPDEQAPAKPRVTITEAVKDGSRREVLVAMRARVARTLEDPATPAHAIARLVREVSDLDREIRAMDEANEDDDAHEGPSAVDDAFDAAAI